MLAKPATDDSSKPRRRWFQFRLRTLLIAVALLAILCPIGARCFREWQRQRELDRSYARIREAAEKLRIDLRNSPPWFSSSRGTKF